MDSLTQIVLGASVGEVALGKRVGNKAMIWGAIAGTIPDLDVLSKNFTDIVTANEIHRGFSHSILFCIIASPILGWLANKIHHNENASWKQWTNLMFWALFTHPLLDAHTTWGTQLFWPFDLRIAYQNIFVADPMYTLPFLLFVAAAAFYKRTDPKRARLNQTGIIISSAYMILTLGLKAITFQKFKESLENQKIEYNEISTRPTPLNSILWTANVDTRGAYYLGYYSLFDKDDYVDYERILKNRELYPYLLKEDKVKRLIQITKGWYLIEKVGDNFLFYDLRFGQMQVAQGKNEFVFKYELKYVNGVLEVTQIQPDLDNAGPAFKLLLKRIAGK